MSILQILDEISSESSILKKTEILKRNSDNVLLKDVIYVALSPRVKFYTKVLPASMCNINYTLDLFDAISLLKQALKDRIRGFEFQQVLVDVSNSVSGDDWEVVRRIILKDLRIGIGSSIVNKVFANLVEETPYMGAKPFDVKLVRNILSLSQPAFSQVKMDGRYCNAMITDGDVVLESRQGEITPIIARFVDDLRALPNCVLNGELTVDGMSRYISNGLISSISDIESKRTTRGIADTNGRIKEIESTYNMSYPDICDSIVYTVWDVIDLEEYHGFYSIVPYFTRFDRVTGMVAGLGSNRVRIVETKRVGNYDDAMSHFQEQINKGNEGTILKAFDCPWKDGKPAKQVKLKLEMSVDLSVVGFNMGTGKNSDVVSSLTCTSSDGFLTTRPTGISEKMMRYITDNRESLLFKIIEVKCSGLSFDSDMNYSLLHPVFKSFRDDKYVADSLEDIKKNERMIKGLV